MLTREYKFLLVDDDPEDVMLFNEAIYSISPLIKITTLINGEALMQHLHAHTDNLPDILFLDLNMPFKNGVDCLKEIKTNEQLKNLMVIIYTTFLLPETFVSLHEEGASLVFIKSPIFVHLKNSLKNIVDIMIKSLPNNN